MKKTLVFALAAALIALAVFWFMKPRSTEHAAALKFFTEEGLTADEAGHYQLTLEAVQKATESGKADTVLVRVQGLLDQYVDGTQKYFSAWNRLDTWILNGQEIDAELKASLLGKNILSVATDDKVEHFLDESIPKEVFRTQLNLMQKLILPRLPAGVEAVEKAEAEELGTYSARYTSRVDGRVEWVQRSWLRYDREDVKVDGQKNHLVYVMSREGRLIGAHGVLLLKVKGAALSDFEIRLNVDLQGKSPRPKTLPDVSLGMTRADEATVQAVASELRARSGMTYSDALKKLGAVTEATDGRELYQIFSALKADMIAHPERGAELVERILATKGRDAGARRQIAAMFGALAQSQSPAIADALSGMATSCPDTYCKEQAIVALNDHQNPTPASADKMLELVKTKPDANIASMAVLAAGSIGKKMAVPDLPKLLLEEFKKPTNEDIKRSIVAGMGNHGAADYLPALQESLRDKEPTMRATATYSLRHLNNSTVNPLLLGILESEKSPLVLKEAFKAMNYRSFQGDEYGRVAKKSLEFKDEELATDAANFLLRSYAKDPASVDSSLKLLHEKSTFVSVKRLIESEGPNVR